MTSFMLMTSLTKQSFNICTVILLIMLYTSTLGIFVEVVQANFDREMDYADLYRNFLGCFLAISLFQLKKVKSNKVFIAAFIVICSLIIIDQKALLSALSLKYQQYQKIPTLADFS